MIRRFCWGCDEPSTDLRPVGDISGETRGGATVMWCPRCRAAGRPVRRRRRGR